MHVALRQHRVVDFRNGSFAHLVNKAAEPSHEGIDICTEFEQLAQNLAKIGLDHLRDMRDLHISYAVCRIFFSRLRRHKDYQLFTKASINSSLTGAVVLSCSPLE